MGNFYTNITLRTTQTDAVLRALRGRAALVSRPLGADTLVVDKLLESQDPGALEAVAARLASELETMAWAVLNHDDDVLQVSLFDRQACLYRYNSAPGFGSLFGRRKPKGDPPATLCQPFGRLEAEPEVAAILARPHGPAGYLFEVQRHAALAEALGWPQASVAFGYRYLTQGEFPPDLTQADFRSP